MAQTDDGKLVINFYGAPGSGKTVAATSLFANLKRRHMDAVLVSEFAHAKVVEENKMGLQNQLWIWANQQYNIFCGYNHADVVVTDSPILLGSVYNKGSSPALHQLVMDEHRKYNNFNIVMELDESFPYSMVGRIHDQTQSLAIQNDIIELLEVHDITYARYKDYTEDDIADIIMDCLG